MPLSVPRNAIQSPFGCFVLGRAVSLAGSAMTPVALSLAVLQASHHMSDLGVVLAAQVTAHLSLLLVGGVMGDRWPRWALLVATNLGAGLTQGLVAAVLLTGHYQLAPVACLQFVNGALEALGSPALRGIVPELVEPAQLPRANAILATVKNLGVQRSAVVHVRPRRAATRRTRRGMVRTNQHRALRGGRFRSRSARPAQQPLSA
ncbi:MFS transporter [Mycobacterium sp. 1245852.3]|uniref:MFS transporter n=1 Tax=Mycobacterium sp. 1245852.3 TaxID=1856860 RepID=UPI0009EDC8EB